MFKKSTVRLKIWKGHIHQNIHRQNVISCFLKGISLWERTRMAAKMLWVERGAEPRPLPLKPHLATPRSRMSCGMVRILTFSVENLSDYFQYYFKYSTSASVLDCLSGLTLSACVLFFLTGELLSSDVYKQQMSDQPNSKHVICVRIWFCTVNFISAVCSHDFQMVCVPASSIP